MATIEMCPCGRPLHYTSLIAEYHMRRLVADLGEFIEVEVLGLGRYAVPRHYLALHGLRAQDLPTLGFEKVAKG